MSLRLCLQTKQYTYYFSKSLTWNLFHIVQSRNDYIFSVFVLKSTSVLSQTSFPFFHPRSRERNDEYKFDEECFPAKVSLLLRGSKGPGHWSRRGRRCLPPIRLYQNRLRISLVRAIDKLSLFMNKNLTLATNYHTIQIQRTRRNKVFLVKSHFNVITNSLV